MKEHYLVNLRTVVMGAITFLLSVGLVRGLTVLEIPLKMYYGVNDAQVALFSSALLFGYALGGVLSGYTVAKYSLRLQMGLCGTSCIIGVALVATLMYLKSVPLTVIILLFLVGLPQGLSINCLISSIYANVRPSNVGLVTTLAGGGTSLGGLILPLIYESWHRVFLGNPQNYVFEHQNSRNISSDMEASGYNPVDYPTKFPSSPQNQEHNWDYSCQPNDQTYCLENLPIVLYLIAASMLLYYIATILILENPNVVTNQQEDREPLLQSNERRNTLEQSINTSQVYRGRITDTLQDDNKQKPSLISLEVLLKPTYFLQILSQVSFFCGYFAIFPILEPLLLFYGIEKAMAPHYLLIMGCVEICSRLIYAFFLTDHFDKIKLMSITYLGDGLGFLICLLGLIGGLPSEAIVPIIITCFVVSGFFNAGFGGLVFATLSEIVEPKYYAVAVGMQSIAIGVGETLGPIVGGLIVDAVSWDIPENKPNERRYWAAVAFGAAGMILSSAIVAGMICTFRHEQKNKRQILEEEQQD